MSSVLKKAKKKDGVAVNSRYKWVEFETEDGQVIRCHVRTSLMYSEIEALVDLDVSADREKVWDAAWPYVEAWNLQVELDDGETYDVLPPKTGGPESFKFAPGQLVWAIIGALINEPFKKIDPKSSTPVESTESK